MAIRPTHARTATSSPCTRLHGHQPGAGGARSGRRWRTICSATRTSTTSSLAFAGTEPGDCGDVQDYMNANPRFSPTSTESPSPSPTFGIAAMTSLIWVSHESVDAVMDPRGGDRFGAHRRPWGDRHYSRTRGRECRRMCKRRPPGICEWLREPLRRSCALRSAASLLRAHAVQPPPPPNVTGCVSYNGRWVNAGS